jgi:beta-carotene 3-hydroxylase
MMNGVLWIVGAFVVMEPVTYAAHRWLMHGPGMVLHRSHHRVSGGGRLEANDWFPVMFATVVCAGLALGFNVAGFGTLVPVGIGVTLYGAAYALVHDVYVHGRLPLFARRHGAPVAGLEQLAEAHRLHHRFGGEPYGMLLPVVPAALKARAAAASPD